MALMRNKTIAPPAWRLVAAAGVLGWVLDAFDFFVLTYVLNDVARDFHRTRPDIALTLTASLAMRLNDIEEGHAL